MQLYTFKTWRALAWMYPHFLWQKDRGHKEVYLTFDDGPIPEVTPFVLNCLQEHKAHASFFCIGDNMQKYPEVLAAIKAAGHTIGNHTFHHLNGWKVSHQEYLDDFQKAQKIEKSKFFRPPYGKIRRRAAYFISKHSKIVMWDVLSGDFDPKISGETCAEKVLQHCKNGSIVVFHDSLKAQERLFTALPIVLKELSARGYQFKAL